MLRDEPVCCHLTRRFFFASRLCRAACRQLRVLSTCSVRAVLTRWDVTQQVVVVDSHPRKRRSLLILLNLPTANCCWSLNLGLYRSFPLFRPTLLPLTTTAHLPLFTTTPPHHPIFHHNYYLPFLVTLCHCSCQPNIDTLHEVCHIRNTIAKSPTSTSSTRIAI